MTWPIAFQAHLLFFQVTAVEYVRIGLPQIVSPAVQEPKLEEIVPIPWALLQYLFPGEGGMLLSPRGISVTEHPV